MFVFSLSFILIHLLKPCRMADEWVNEFISADRLHKATQIVKSWGCCKWYTILHCTWPLILAEIWVFFDYVSLFQYLRESESPASQLWLGHGQYARDVLSWNVADFQNWIFDPSREMGKGTSWRWDDHGLWCRKQGGQAGPDQRPSP